MTDSIQSWARPFFNRSKAIWKRKRWDFERRATKHVTWGAHPEQYFVGVQQELHVLNSQLVGLWNVNFRRRQRSWGWRW